MSTSSLAELERNYVRHLLAAPAEASVLPVSVKVKVRDTKATAVERAGRRFLIAREIYPRFTEALAVLRIEQLSAFAASSLFSDFLKSEFFREPNLGLPHPDRLGRGYENVSKFFFYMREKFLLRKTTSPIELRQKLYLAMALHLLVQLESASDPHFQNFARGFFWQENCADSEAWFVLAPDFNLTRVEASDAQTLLHECGLYDVDKLEPSTWSELSLTKPHKEEE